MTTKFGKQVHLCVDPNENNQAGAGDVITSRICDQLKLFCVYYHSAYGHQFFSIVTNFEQLLAMFLHPLVYPLVTWSCKIIWQIKNIFFSSTTVPMTNLAPNWAGVTYHEGILPTKSHEPWIRWSHVKKQKTYLDYHNAYGHKTLQEASIHNVTWPYTQAVLQDRVTN